jgi:hypothetical protein
MRKREYFDQFGAKWIEIIHSSRKRLLQLKEMYQQEGGKCWIFPYFEDDGREKLELSVVFQPKRSYPRTFGELLAG